MNSHTKYHAHTLISRIRSKGKNKQMKIMIIINGDFLTRVSKYLPENATIKYFSSKNDLNNENIFNVINDFDLIIILGGPQFVSEIENFTYLINLSQLITHALNQSIPLIGICLGMHLIAKVLGLNIGKLNHLNVGFTSFIEHPKLFYCHYEMVKNDNELQNKLATFDEIHYNMDKSFVTYFRTGNVIGIQAHPDIDPGLIKRFSPYTYISDEALRHKETIDQENKRIMQTLIDKIIRKKIE
jgi:anthranilate/para-aminobenzoate synthase component II